MHLTALVDNPDHVCCRYRVAAFRPLLERAGHSLELRPWPRHWWDWFRLGRDLHGADAVLVQRRLLAGWQLQLLRRQARRLLFDFDDAVFLRDSYAARGLYSGRRLRRFAAVVSAADTVIAGNRFLADEASQWTESRVQVIPTCVDPGRYPEAKHVLAGNGVQLVWVGSSSTLQGLEQMQPSLDEIGRGCPGLRLKLICDRFLNPAGLPVQPCPWTAATEAADIAAGDIGISWVPDDMWSRGKCALKVLQYMAAGLPVVANPIGVQADLVRPGETGFLAATAAEWLTAIRTLAHDPGLRRRLGRAARQRVEAEFSVAAGGNAWRTVLAGLEPQREVA